MFEKFGLKDALLGLYKYKHWILISMTIFALVSSVKEIVSQKGESSTTQYTIEAEYRFDAVRAPQDFQVVLNSQEYSGGQVVATYLTLFDTEAFRENVVQKLEDNGYVVSTNEVENCLSASLLEDNFILSIVINSSREEIVQPMLEAVYSYMVNSQNLLYGMPEDSIKVVGKTAVNSKTIVPVVNYSKSIVIGDFSRPAHELPGVI